MGGLGVESHDIRLDNTAIANIEYIIYIWEERGKFNENMKHEKNDQYYLLASLGLSHLINFLNWFLMC